MMDEFLLSNEEKGIYCGCPVCVELTYQIQEMTKTCKICKTKFEPKRSTLEPTCDNYDCKVSYALIQVKKQRDKQDKEQKKVSASNKKVAKEKLKTLSDYEAEAKKSFQKWIRLRDKDFPCISCGEFNKDLWDGGHYFKAELYSGLIFNEKNCHKQCRKCNRYLGGSEISYRMGLVERYGKGYVEELESISASKRVYKYTKFELIEKKKEYDLKIKNFNK